jgi:hypothetical protein
MTLNHRASVKQCSPPKQANFFFLTWFKHSATGLIQCHYHSSLFGDKSKVKFAIKVQFIVVGVKVHLRRDCNLQTCAVVVFSDIFGQK